MGPQILIIPALFIAICLSFIILHSCYHRWKVSSILRKKRDAAKISLVNILQMTNASLITPIWSSANGAVKSNIKPIVLVSDETATDGKVASFDTCCKMEKSHYTLSSPSKFDPRNPNLLSSSVFLSNQESLHPPCYEDLYGSGRAVFTFKSLSPERDDPPPPFSPQLSQKNYGECKDSHGGAYCTNEGECGQYQYNNGNRPCLLHIPPQDIPVPSQERRNSSAVLYL